MKNYKSVPNVHEHDTRQRHADGSSTGFESHFGGNGPADITHFAMPGDLSQKTMNFEHVLKPLLRTLAHTADRYQGEIIKVSNGEQNQNSY